MGSDLQVELFDGGQRLVRDGSGKGFSLAEKFTAEMHQLSYRTIFHRMRLKGRYPLKLIAAPHDPMRGDPDRGRALLSGRMEHGGCSVELSSLYWRSLRVPEEWLAWAHGFSWLRDLAAAADRQRGAKVAEPIVRSWLASFGEFDKLAWSPEVLGTRILFWSAYAPYILSNDDLVYRSAVLNGIARGARHLDRTVGRVADGLAQVRAAAGLIAAGLLLPGGEARQARGEAAIERAVADYMMPDGGVRSRAPLDQLELLELLLLLLAFYRARGTPPCESAALATLRLVPALKATELGDGALGAWHGGGVGTAERLARAVDLSGVIAEPTKRGLHSGFQRLTGGKVVLVLDAGPPPEARALTSGHASTLSFQMSDGPTRLVVDCGGSRGVARPLPPDLVAVLRTTAAHSTLVLSDTNSTRIRLDGRLGRGVTEVVVSRFENEGGELVEASHDGYRRRFGLDHHRRLYVSETGDDVRGEDRLEPTVWRSPADLPFDIRFHLGPDVLAEAADDNAVRLLLGDGRRWWFLARGGTVAIEESLWIDPAGRPATIQQIVVSGSTATDGAKVSWLFRREEAGRTDDA